MMEGNADEGFVERFGKQWDGRPSARCHLRKGAPRNRCRQRAFLWDLLGVKIMVEGFDDAFRDRA